MAEYKQKEKASRRDGRLVVSPMAEYKQKEKASLRDGRLVGSPGPVRKKKPRAVTIVFNHRCLNRGFTLTGV